MNSEPKKILVLGDSHARECFSKMKELQPEFDFDVKFVSGATAQGAVNPTSKTNALNIFKKKLAECNADSYHYVMIMLGEVDCGFVMWYRSEKHNISVKDQLHLSISNLFNFIKNEVLEVFNPDQVILAGSVLPTIKDDQDWGEIAHLRKSIKATQKQRTELTLTYNQTLKALSSSHNYLYIDITDETINKNTNTISDEFLNSDRSNHHLSFEKTYSFWLNNLRKTLPC
jgi:hypothetical protein